MPSGRYFDYFSTVPYEAFDGSGEYKVVTNIFKRVRATLESRTDKTIYYNYAVTDTETPEIVSYKYYGAAHYHWVILLMNSIRDPQWCWPLDQTSFEKYIVNKYGSFETAVTTHSHYETKEIRARVSGYGYSVGDVVLKAGMAANANFTYSYAGDDFGVGDTLKSVTMYAKEDAENEAKRNIILLRRNLLGEFIEEFDNLVVTRR
jgi:hypothetical protein